MSCTDIPDAVTEGGPTQYQADIFNHLANRYMYVQLSII